MSKYIDNLQSMNYNRDEFSMMKVNIVKSLQEFSIDFIVKNYERLIMSRSLFLPWNIAAHILERLNYIFDGLEESHLKMFYHNLSCLTYITMDGNKLCTQTSLRFLRNHKLESLEVKNLKNCNVEDWLCYLTNGECLKYLNVSHCTIGNDNVKLSLKRFPNLVSLNVSSTSFSDKNLSAVVKQLTCLSALNISCTKVTDIEILVNLQTLKILIFKDANDRTNFKNLTRLNGLKVLDISRETCSGLKKHSVDPLLKDESCLPHIKYLDISGGWQCSERIMM